MPYFERMTLPDDALPASAPSSLPATATEGGDPVPRRVVRAWSLWDFGQQSFNTVILTFVFSVYVTSLATTERQGSLTFFVAGFVAAVIVAVLAPALGTYADRLKNSRRLLTVTTLVTILSMASLWFVQPEYEFFLFGVIMIQVASVFSELASVFYNAMLLRISTPATYGRISGTAWGLGYIGGVLALVITLFGFVLDGGMLGLTTDGAVNFRAIALLCAGWFLVFGLPLLLLAPADTPGSATERVTFFGSYRVLVERIRQLWNSQRHVLHFYLASAVYRDGLSAVFGIAGVLAANSYGFPPEEVIYFGLAANLVAGIGTWVAGRIDDAIGPRRVIIAALVAILVVGTVIILVDAKLVFWVGGLLISVCVGPIQSASRSMLARLTPVKEASEAFGLYATTGRAASWLGLGAVAAFGWVTGDERLGIIGVVVVLAIGLALFLRIPRTEREQAQRLVGAAAVDR